MQHDRIFMASPDLGHGIDSLKYMPEFSRGGYYFRFFRLAGSPRIKLNAFATAGSRCRKKMIEGTLHRRANPSADQHDVDSCFRRGTVRGDQVSPPR